MTLMHIYIYAYKERGFPWYAYQLASYLKVWEYAGHVWLILCLSKYIHIHIYYNIYNIYIYTCVCGSSILQNLQAPSHRLFAQIRMIRMRIGFESAYEDSEVRDEALRAYLLLGWFARIWPSDHPSGLDFTKKYVSCEIWLVVSFIYVCYVPFDNVKDFSGRYFSQPRSMGQSCGLISGYVLARCGVAFTLHQINISGPWKYPTFSGHWFSNPNLARWQGLCQSVECIISLML